MAVYVGLTGGIATGKSLISNYLKTNGIAVIDADQVAHDVLEEPSVIRQLTELFGTQIIKNGLVDRKTLGTIVFADSHQLDQLNQIVQPVIRKKIIKKEHQLATQKVVFLDAPLLFEQGYTDGLDYIMVVSTDAVTQLKRLIQRNNLSKRQAHQRIDAQLPLKIKKQRADIIIDNSGSTDNTISQVENWLKQKQLI